MGEITRKSTKEETLELQRCPGCTGKIDITSCGYASFNVATADCCGRCKKSWELKYPTDLWAAGEMWNELSARIAEKLDSVAFLADINRPRPSIMRNYAEEERQKKAATFLRDLRNYVLEGHDFELPKKGI